MISSNEKIYYSGKLSSGDSIIEVKFRLKGDLTDHLWANRWSFRVKSKSSKMIGEIISSGDIIIYESTVFPGCTEEICIPILEKASGLKYNSDFYCGYSPERIVPGDKVNTLTKIKKVTSGSTPKIADFIDDLYSSIIDAGTFKASSIKVAEASKAIENAQRDLNISFVNISPYIHHI